MTALKFIVAGTALLDLYTEQSWTCRTSDAQHLKHPNKVIEKQNVKSTPEMQNYKKPMKRP